MTEQGTRKPTAAQRRAMIAATEADGHLPYPGNTPMYRRIVEAGWAETVSINTPRLTRAGYMAVAQAHLFALPEVKVGDLVRYVTHTGCVGRVADVRDGGRVIMYTYVAVCGVCEHGSGAADPAERREPGYGHMHPQTLAGEPSDAWRAGAFLVEPVPADEAAQIERDIKRTAAVFAATRTAFDNGVEGVRFPTPLYADTIRPAYLAEWCQWCKIDFWAASGSASDRTAAHKAYHAAAEQRAAADDPTVAPESFNAANGVLDGPAAQRMRDELIAEHARDLGVGVEDAERDLRRRADALDPSRSPLTGQQYVAPIPGYGVPLRGGPAREGDRDRLLLADVPVDDLAPCTLAAGHDGRHDDPTGRIDTGDGPAMAAELRERGVDADECAQPIADPLPAPAATPRFPAGTAEYERYAAELNAELRKFVKLQQPYGDREPETAYARLSEEYGQDRNDHDENPTHAGFDQWLAEQVERLRIEVAMRDAGRRANLGIAQLVRAYGAQLVSGDTAGAAAALNAVQDHVAGLLAGLALAGGERVRKTFEECEGVLRAAGLAGGEDVRSTIEARKLRDERHPAPFAVGDRVTWGRGDTLDGLRVWHVTRVQRGDDGRWSVSARLAGGRGETGTTAPADQFNRLPAMPDAHRVFTFGTAHSHPDAPAGDLGKHFVRIPGDAETARARMLATFGRNWAFDYAPMRFEPQVERFGLIEVAPPSFLAGMVELASDPDLRAHVIEQLGSQQLDELAAELRYGSATR